MVSRTPATKAEPADARTRPADAGVASGVNACDPGTEAAPAAWSSLDGNLRTKATPWAMALSDPHRQVSWLAGQGLMHAFPGHPSGCPGRDPGGASRSPLTVAGTASVSGASSLPRSLL